MIDPPTPPPKIPANEFPKVPRLLSGMAAPAALPPIAPLIRLMMRLVVSMTTPPRMNNCDRQLLTGVLHQQIHYIRHVIVLCTFSRLTDISPINGGRNCQK